MFAGSSPFTSYDLRPRRSLMTAARDGVLPAHLQALDHEIGPGPGLVLTEVRELGLGEVGVLLHGGLHLLGSGIGQRVRAEERQEIRTLQHLPRR